LRLVAWGGTLELLTDGLDRRSARSRDGGGAAKVRIDSSKDFAVVGLYGTLAQSRKLFGRAYLDVLDDDAA
jgi:hypothetical protein